MQRKSLDFTSVADNSSLWQDSAYMDHQMNSSAFEGPELLVRRAHPNSLSSKTSHPLDQKNKISQEKCSIKEVAEATVCLGKKTAGIYAFCKKLPLTVMRVWELNTPVGQRL